MKRTWALWIGLTMLLASVCAGMEEYAEPVPNEVSPDEVTYTVTDSKPDGSYEVIDPAPPGDYAVADPGFDSGSEVIDPKPDESGEAIDTTGRDRILTVITDGSKIDPDAEVVTMVLDGGSEVTPVTADAGLRMLAAVPDVDYAFTLTPTPTELAASLGMAGFIVSNDLGTSPTNTCLNWDTMPELAQVRSGVGMGMAAQIAPYANGTLNLPDFTGQLDNVTSQISLGARDAFGAIPIPGIAQLLANQ